MDHVAILSKHRKLLHKILSGEKTIESRWYKSKRTPYKNISTHDKIYFKESGEPVTAIAEVSNAIFFDDLDNNRITQILTEHGKQICLPISYAPELSGKNFCTLIFLQNVKKIEPFHINKTGYGLMAAWITVKNIDNIKIREP